MSLSAVQGDTAGGEAWAGWCEESPRCEVDGGSCPARRSTARAYDSRCSRNESQDLPSIACRVSLSNAALFPAREHATSLALASRAVQRHPHTASLNKLHAVLLDMHADTPDTDLLGDRDGRDGVAQLSLQASSVSVLPARSPRRIEREQGWN